MSGELSGRQPHAIRLALDVLRTVVQAGPGITAKEISAALRLSPATTYRIINVLVGEEYLVRLGDLSGFALGARYAELVVAAPNTDTRRRQRRGDHDEVDQPRFTAHAHKEMS